MFSIRFVWPEFNTVYDCIVGIYVNGTPVGLGVFVRTFAIITSANIFGKWTEKKRYYEPDPSDLEVYAINGTWNKAVKMELDYVSGNQVDRNDVWVKVGFDNRHTTIHDFVFITLKYVRVDESLQFRGWYSRTPYRAPFFDVKRVRPYSPYGWKFAAFGFVDKAHIEESLRLVSADYSWEAVLEDCDEWIPRPWGRFICLANIDNYLGIQAGAPLFYGNDLYGLGAFELNKGNESILVFSEFKPYLEWSFMYYSTFTTEMSPYDPRYKWD